MKALLFPGQGSQTVGMALEFYNNFKTVKKIFDEADDSLNFKISKVILEGPDDDLKLTQNTQPAILVVSWAIFSILKSDFGLKQSDFKYYAGHSLGEYSALVCSGSLITSTHPPAKYSHSYFKQSSPFEHLLDKLSISQKTGSSISLPQD